MPPTDEPTLKVKLVKSTIAHNPRNRATVEALGLKKIGQVIIHKDTPSIRGMIRKVQNLVVVESRGEPIVDATHPGSSARMLDARVHRRFPSEKPAQSAPAPETPAKVARTRKKAESQ